MAARSASSFDELVDTARGLASGGRRAILGIAGSPGAGKSTLAGHLLTALASTPPPGIFQRAPEPGAPATGWVSLVPMDGFHLANEELERLGLRDRKGAPETFDVLGYTHLLRRIAADAEPVIYAPLFARDLDLPIAGAVPVGAEVRLVITEGNYLLLDEGPWDGIRQLLDAAWFCAPSDSVRLERLVRRHVRFGKSPAAAHDWAHGTDERNARRVLAGRDRADLIVGPQILDQLAPA